MRFYAPCMRFVYLSCLQKNTLRQRPMALSLMERKPMAKLMAMSRPGIPRKPIRIMASRSMSELWGVPSTINDF